MMKVTRLCRRRNGEREGGKEEKKKTKLHKQTDKQIEERGGFERPKESGKDE